MKKLQMELDTLIDDFDVIHSKVPKDHRYHQVIESAEKQFNSEEQTEIRNFIFRNWVPNEPSEESWKTDSEEEVEDKNEAQSQPKQESKPKDFSGPAGHLFLKTAHYKFCFLELINQQNKIFFDVQKPWVIYWSCNSLNIVKDLDRVSKENQGALSQLLMGFENRRKGGFSGGTGYQPNIISSFAAVLSLAVLDSPEYYATIDRPKCLNFLSSMKVVLCTDTVLSPRLPKKLQNSKFLTSFRLTRNGEFDIRNIYTSLIIHSMLDLGKQEQVFERTADFILACQSYEGGIGPRPGHEAHGGFTYCGLASLALLGKLSLLDIPQLLRWLCNRQMFYEGGFSGRTNKIVDSCYSFWQGACFNILYEYRHQLPPEYSDISMLYSPEDLQKYLLLGCQLSNGGFQDKPSKGRDMYHTMYSLLGLGLSVNFLEQVPCSERLKEDWPLNAFSKLDPIFTIPRDKVKKFINFWKNN
jgi:protein farnesyltransferase subunit beta